MRCPTCCATRSSNSCSPSVHSRSCRPSIWMWPTFSLLIKTAVSIPFSPAAKSVNSSSNSFVSIWSYRYAICSRRSTASRYASQFSCVNRRDCASIEDWTSSLSLNSSAFCQAMANCEANTSKVMMSLFVKIPTWSACMFNVPINCPPTINGTAISARVYGNNSLGWNIGSSRTSSITTAVCSAAATPLIDPLPTGK